MAQKLHGLNSVEYEHPFDRAALDKLKRIPILTEVVNFVMNWTYIKWQIVGMCGSNFHITKKSCLELYKIAEEAISSIDIKRLPNVYMEQNYDINACTSGYKEDVYVVLTSGAVDKLTNQELAFVIGHEAGHIKSNHVIYHMMVAYFNELLRNVPGSGLIKPALAYWNRMSEFTADRAGLLACQDLNASLRAIVKMTGMPERFYDNISIEGFMEHAKEFSSRYGSTADEMIKLFEILTADHPWTIVRASELIKWVESGEYQKILDNHRSKKCKDCGHHVAIDTAICPFCGANKFE